MTKTGSFLRYIHDFRGFAILTIVAGHVLNYMHWVNEIKTQVITSIFLENGSVYFIFIAGFLFQFLSDRYKYKQYLNKKVQYVVIPYIFMSIPALFFCLIGRFIIPQPWFSNLFANWSSFGQAIMLLLTGAHLRPFWFIPMIILFYVAAPIFIWIDRHPKTYWSLPLLLAVSVIIPRPFFNENTLQSFVHFFSVYTLGMFSCHFRERLFIILKKHWQSLVLFVAILTVIEAFVTPRPLSINTLSKSTLSLAIVYFLWRVDAYLPKLFHTTMNLFAELSFGIYFIHMYFIQAYFELAPKYLGLADFWTQANPLVFLIVLSITIILSVATLLLARKVFDKNSRYIVGC